MKGLTSATLPATTVVTNIPAPVWREGKSKMTLNRFLSKTFTLVVRFLWTWGHAYQTRPRQPGRQCEDEKMLQWRWRCLELRYQEPEMSRPQHRRQSRKMCSPTWKIDLSKHLWWFRSQTAANQNKVSTSGGRGVQWKQIKDTATLWVRCRQVEMADRLGQKLEETQEKIKIAVIRNAISYYTFLRTFTLQRAASGKVSSRKCACVQCVKWE